MKSKDFTLIAVVAIFSTVASILLTKVVISTEENRSQTVEVVEPITTEFTRPPTDYFNADSINPTRIIEIGPNLDSKPFDGDE